MKKQTPAAKVAARLAAQQARAEQSASGAAPDAEDEEQPTTATEEAPAESGAGTASGGDDAATGGSAAADDPSPADGAEGDDEDEDEAAPNAAQLSTRYPAAAAALRAEGAAAERARLTAIDGVAAKVTGAKAAQLVARAKADPEGSAASLALALVQDGAVAGQQVLTGRDADEAALEAPSGAAGQAMGDATATVARILALHEAHTPKRRPATAGRN